MKKLKYITSSIIMFAVSLILAYKSIITSFGIMTAFEILTSFVCFHMGSDYITDMINNED